MLEGRGAGLFRDFKGLSVVERRGQGSYPGEGAMWREEIANSGKLSQKGPVWDTRSLKGYHPTRRFYRGVRRSGKNNWQPTSLD